MVASNLVRHDFVLPIVTEQHLAEFVWLAFGVQIPNKQICANHSTPWRAFSDAYFARDPVTVWKASRGLAGKTFLLALLSLTEALTLKADVSLLGGSGEQSKRALECMADFWQHPDAPRYLMASEVAREMRFAWGNQVEALMASQTSVRGGHPQRLRCDEIDEMSMPILSAVLGQPMGKNGIVSHVVESSTHQHPDGTMAAVLKEAAEKGHPIYEWCYRESMGTGDFKWVRDNSRWKVLLAAGAQATGWLTPQEVERKRVQMTDSAWDNEVELQEPNPESRAINRDAVRQMFKVELGKFAGEPRQYIEIEKPIPGEKYATGADWAKDSNWSIIITLKLGKFVKDEKGARKTVRPHKLVAFERLGRENWNGIVDRYDERLKRFPGGGLHDETGIGNVITDQITSAGSVGFNFSNVKERARMLNDYCVAIENGEIEAPFISYMEQEHRTAARNDLYGTGHLPDTISGGALALKQPTMAGWVRGAAR